MNKKQYEQYKVNVASNTQGLTSISIGPLCGPCPECNDAYDYHEAEPPDEQPPDEGSLSSQSCDACGTTVDPVGDRGLDSSRSRQNAAEGR